MDRSDRARIGVAVALILLGLWFLAVQLLPPLQSFNVRGENWPLAVVIAGAVFAVIALASWTPGLMVPAFIIGGLGALFYWQNRTDNWASWAYAWALIPGFVGLGVLASELMKGRIREAIVGGGWLILISATLFLIFGSLLGGGAVPFGAYWPVLLILMGLLALVEAFFGRRIRSVAR
ncbi:MAG: hypothetical protein ACM3JD_18210 [Rudaea sp.]